MGNKQRITRDYRNANPGKFLNIVLRVKRGLTDNENYPESAWGGQYRGPAQVFRA
jgi:hypothetical protein